MRWTKAPTGVQVGTAFAFCDESGLRAEIKQAVLQQLQEDDLDVVTDPVASPTGFPFKVLQLDHTLSDAAIYEQRGRVCDLGYLRQAYRREDNSIGWRCAAEETDAYLRKGGDLKDTEGRKCLCNGLVANIGLPQVRRGGQVELPLVTCGDNVSEITRFLPSADATHYSAQDVISHLLSKVRADQYTVCATP